MATQKRLNARIILKHDIEENWNKAVNFIPLKGEMIIYDADEVHTDRRIKYGDGVTKVTELPFHTKQMDWQQSDENQNDFIKNRPVYEDVVEVDYTRLPYFSSSRYGIARDPLNMGYSQVTKKLPLVEGQEYDVITMGSTDGIHWEEWSHKTLTTSVTVEGDYTFDESYELPAGTIKLIDEEDFNTEIYVGVRFNNTTGKIIKSANTCIYWTGELYYYGQILECIINGIPSTDCIIKKLPPHLLGTDTYFSPKSYNPQSGIAVKEAVDGGIIKGRPVISSTLGDQHIKTTLSDDKLYLYTEGIGYNEELKTTNKDTIVDAVNEVVKEGSAKIVNIEGNNLVAFYTDQNGRSSYNTYLSKLSNEDLNENAPNVAYSYNVLGYASTPKYDNKRTFVTTVYDGFVECHFSLSSLGKYTMSIYHYDSKGKSTRLVYRYENTSNADYKLTSEFVEELKNANYFRFLVVQDIETKEYICNLSLSGTDTATSPQWNLNKMTRREDGLGVRVDGMVLEYYTAPTLDSTGKYYSEQRIVKCYNKHYPLTVDEEGFICEDVQNTLIATSHNHLTSSQSGYAGEGYITELSANGKMFYIHTAYGDKYKLIDQEGNEIVSNCVSTHISNYNGKLAVITYVNNTYYLTLVDIDGNIISSVPFDKSIYCYNHIIVGDYIYLFYGTKTYGGKINNVQIKVNESSLPLYVDAGSRLKLYKNNILVCLEYYYTNDRRCSWIPLKKGLKFNETDVPKSINTIDTINTVRSKNSYLTINDISSIPHNIDVNLDLTGKNLFDISKITVNDNTTVSHVSEVGDDYVIVTTPEGYTGNGYTNIPDLTLKDFCPALQIGKTYVLHGETEAQTKGIYLTPIGLLWYFEDPLTITQSMLDSKITLYGLNNTTSINQGTGDCKISNIMVTVDYASSEYSSYFDPSNYPIHITNKNLFDGEWESGVIVLATGENGSTGNGYRTVNYIPITPGETYTFSGGTKLYPCFYDQDYNFLKQTGPYTDTFTFTADENQYYLRILDYQTHTVPTNSQLEVGSVASEYQAYVNTTIYSDSQGKFDVPHMSPSMNISVNNVVVTYERKMDNIYDDITHLQYQIDVLKETPCVVIDEELSEDSTNPVQSKAIFAYIKSLEERIANLEGSTTE